MSKPLGRNFRSVAFRSVAASTVLAFGAAPACSSDDPREAASSDVARSNTAVPEIGTANAALSVTIVPDAVAFGLDLDGQHVELSLARSLPPIATGYVSLRRTASGALVPQPSPDLSCSYRGVAELAGAPGAKPGFATLNVCADATGHTAGTAVSGIIHAGKRYFRLSPDPADQDESDGVDHFAQPLYRNDTPIAAREAAQRVTLAPLSAGPAPRLEFREGTDRETKYVDLIVVNDASRVAELGGNAEQSSIQFVETMNALLDGSGLSPRLRVTLRAQVSFEQDPYAQNLQIANGEVDADTLLTQFLAWGSNEDLPDHDERMLLSGRNFEGQVVGLAGLGVACRSDANGFIVQAGDASGGFSVLSAVHEMGHTLGMNHDDGSSPACPNQGYIMAAVGCGNCTGAEEVDFSSCSIDQFQDFLAGPGYTGLLCIDDVPGGARPSCGDGAVQEGESCDCGSNDCSDIDPCCNGATCQLAGDAECSDFNDTCCQNCAVIGADDPVVCRPSRSSCDIPEQCTGASKDCPSDTFEPAGDECEDDRGNAGACYFGDCRTRGTQCQQIAEQQGNNPDFDNVGEPPANCALGCNVVLCGNGTNACITIGGPALVDGVPCDEGQCVDGQCVGAVDQCPQDPNKTEPGDCGCGSSEADSDDDGVADCADGCPEDGDKQAPGECGCGTADTDADRDGRLDCDDQCPADATKLEPGDCGCGTPDVDTDLDGSADCVDECPSDAYRSVAGICGCGVPDLDTDLDGTLDCVDQCPNDSSRNAPPCGRADSNGASDDSDDGGCAIASTPRSEGGLGGAVSSIGWLALVALPLWRRRRRA